MVTQRTIQLARPTFYDRNPLDVVKNGTVDVGAVTRAQTSDWAYTVPTGKKAFMDSAVAVVVENAAVATNARANAYIRLTPSGAGAVDFIVIFLPSGANAQAQQNVFGGSLTVLAGDVVSGLSLSNNNAVGSDVWVEEAAKFTEYDA